jgi:L-2-hydroxyglutarate oxidase
MAQTRLGAGIVGLATAMQIQMRFPSAAITVLEKESGVALHQSSHNSGVIHSGIYYKPGSLKARLCVSGAAAMIRFCEEHGIPAGKCGKVIAATHAAELPNLSDLMTRGIANGVAGLRLIRGKSFGNWNPTPQRSRPSMFQPRRSPILGRSRQNTPSWFGVEEGRFAAAEG